MCDFGSDGYEIDRVCGWNEIGRWSFHLISVTQIGMLVFWCYRLIPLRQGKFRKREAFLTHGVSPGNKGRAARDLKRLIDRTHFAHS